MKGNNTEITPADILFEDNHLLIYNKKPSQIVQGDKTGDLPLSELLKEYIRIRDSKPGNVFLGVVHRIDRPVSGTVIFAKSAKALSRMNILLRDGGIRKKYWAVVREKPKKENDHLVHFLKKNEMKNLSVARDKEFPGSRRSELKYELIGKSDTYYLLEVELLTGRHHQIRAQLSAVGCPIKGDLKYGYERSNPDGSIHLHAREVSFVHPVRKELVRITADPPAEKLWDYFKKIQENKQ